MRTAPGTIWLLAAAMVLTVGVSTGAVAATRCPPGAGCPVDVTKLSLTGVQVGQALVAILAVLMVGAEYGAAVRRRGPEQARCMSEPEGLKGAPEASGKHSMRGSRP
ncbi:MAG TPA: hypothetical protein VGR98_22810 [Streptosporangiaceae bacterium]|nr:hypothetical protein [Streptosporangiaceae bacterium]